MDYGQALWIYLVLVFGIIVVPGMDMFFVLANVLTGGRCLGMAAIAGIMLGGAVHTIIVAVIVGAVTQQPQVLFQSMIVIGAAYMAWIGLSLVRSSIVVGSFQQLGPSSDWVVFRQGLITSLLNPKAYLFVLAVFPQFMRPEFGPIWSQTLVLGLTTVVTQFVVYGAVALAAGRARDGLIGNPQATIWIGRAAGALFLLVAVFTALHGLTTHVGA